MRDKVWCFATNPDHLNSNKVRTVHNDHRQKLEMDEEVFLEAILPVTNRIE